MVFHPNVGQLTLQSSIANLAVDPEDQCLINLLRRMIEFLVENEYQVIKNVPLRQYPMSPKLAEYEAAGANKEPNKVFSISSDVETIRSQMLSSDRLRWLYSFFFLGVPTSKKTAEVQLGRQLSDDAIDCGVFVALPDDEYRSMIRFVPTGNTVYLTSVFDRTCPHFTYLSYDSLIFSQLVADRLSVDEPSRRILDYCCGTGFVGLGAVRPEDALDGIDLSPSAIWFSRLNAVMLGVTDKVRFSRSSTPPTKGEYDLILCNPPYVHDKDGQEVLLDSSGGTLHGCEKTMDFLGAFRDLLSPDGVCYMITRSPIMGDGSIFLYNHLCGSNLGFEGEVVKLGGNVSSVEAWAKAEGISDYTHLLICARKGSNGRSWKLIRPESVFCSYAF